MILSNLTSIVTSVIGARKADISNDVFNYEIKVKDIEVKLNMQGKTYFPIAMQEIQDLFGKHLEVFDYQKIEEQIKYTIDSSGL